MALENIEYIEVDDWDNLRYKINKYFAHWPEYVFRGQAQDNWLLESTLSRTLKKIKYKDKQSLEKQHLRRFNLEIRGRRGDNPRILDENEIWALGQHFGLHTPLLDWTQSPWVALFFALTGQEKTKTGKRAIWALHIPDIELISNRYKGNNLAEKKIELIEPIVDENSRLVNQRGLFTKIPSGVDIENWVKESPKIGNWITLYKITFPEHLKPKLLLYLNLMNINHSSLFPDLYGSAKYTNLKLTQIDSIQKTKRLEFRDKLDDEE